MAAVEMPAIGQRVDVAPGRALHIHRDAEGRDRPVALYDAGAFGIYADGVHVAAALNWRGFDTICLTRAGLYGSDDVPAGVKPDPFFHASDMLRLLDALNVRQPILLVGHSMAGLRLHALAALAPERLGAILFIDAVTPGQLGWPVRRSLVRASTRLITVCSLGVRSVPGRTLARLYPNNIGLEGPFRDDKMASLASARHLSGTRAEMLASTSPALRSRLLPLPADLPRACVTATLVGKGAADVAANGELLHLPQTGHAAVLGVRPAASIAELGARLWVEVQRRKDGGPKLRHGRP